MTKLDMTKKIMQKSRALFSLLLLFPLVIGCAPKMVNTTPLSSLQPAQPQPVIQTAYHLGIGDEIEIKFFFAPELNDRMFIRPDGKISIMFAQDIQAAGLTTDELASNIKAVLAPHVKQLDLVVIVRAFASQRVTVAGEVFKPGPVQLTAGAETVAQALGDAGWITPAAGTDKVVVVRRGVDGQEKIYPVNLAKLMSGEDMAQNVIVQPGDLVLVPPSDIIFADRWIDQNIRQLLPITPSVGISYNVNTNPKN